MPHLGTSAPGAHARRFGAYPYGEADVVLDNGFWFGGMEYPGFVLDRVSSTALAHELAHQWWYGIVGDDEYNDPWLDEGFTDYATDLYFNQTRAGCGITWQSSAERLTNSMAYWDAHSSRYGTVVYGYGKCTLHDLRRFSHEPPRLGGQVAGVGGVEPLGQRPQIPQGTRPLATLGVRLCQQHLGARPVAEGQHVGAGQGGLGQLPGLVDPPVVEGDLRLEEIELRLVDRDTGGAQHAGGLVEPGPDQRIDGLAGAAAQRHERQPKARPDHRIVRTAQAIGGALQQRHALLFGAGRELGGGRCPQRLRAQRGGCGVVEQVEQVGDPARGLDGPAGLGLGGDQRHHRPQPVAGGDVRVARVLVCHLGRGVGLADVAALAQAVAQPGVRLDQQVRAVGAGGQRDQPGLVALPVGEPAEVAQRDGEAVPDQPGDGQGLGGRVLQRRLEGRRGGVVVALGPARLRVRQQPGEGDGPAAFDSAGGRAAPAG